MPRFRLPTKILATLLLVGAGGLVFLALKMSRFGTASPDYTVEDADADADAEFEIRRYPDLAVVSAPMDNSSRPSSDAAFRQLFRYITGGNNAGTSIPMTTPVLTSAEGGTTPRRMRFVLPADYLDSQPPLPADGSLQTEVLAGCRFAVLRFAADDIRPQPAEDALARLRTILDKRGIGVADAPPVFAYYDPPWTPPFLRRNEVLLRVLPKI